MLLVICTIGTTVNGDRGKAWSCDENSKGDRDRQGTPNIL